MIYCTVENKIMSTVNKLNHSGLYSTRLCVDAYCIVGRDMLFSTHTPVPDSILYYLLLCDKIAMCFIMRFRY